MKPTHAGDTGQPSVEYRLEEDGRFVIQNYNWARPFSNFLPGIGGEWGVPTWVFYVNRGQCVSKHTDLYSHQLERHSKSDNHWT